MSRWGTMPHVVMAYRPDPNGRSTWALALVTAGLWAAGVLVAFGPAAAQFPLGGAPDLAPLIPIAVVRALAGIALAVADDVDARARLGRRLADPWIAVLSPTLYLLVRMVRESDPRGGRPFWTGAAICAGSVLLLAFLAVGGF